MKRIFDQHFLKLCVVALVAGGGLFFVVESWFGFGQSTPKEYIAQNELLQSDTTTSDTANTHTTKRIPFDDSNMVVDTEHPAATEQTISIEVNGLKPQAANVCFAIFENADGFPRAKNANQMFAFPAESESATFEVVVSNQKPIAIAVYQDLDGNGQLSKSDFGIPNEPYGFSNNARGTFGPPSFADTSVDISDTDRILTITLK